MPDYLTRRDQKRPEDPKQITLPDISIDTMTEAFATVDMPVASKKIDIRPLVDKKLDKLMEQLVIVQPMVWVSSLACSWRADGDLRTCLNPSHLNKVIRQEYYRTPILERNHP